MKFMKFLQGKKIIQISRRLVSVNSASGRFKFEFPRNLFGSDGFGKEFALHEFKTI